jgi:hypothetical protein
MRPLVRTTLLGMAALAASGCSQPFTPASVVEDLRVLAVVASPPELDGSVSGASSTLRAVVARPLSDTTPVVESWSFCPFSAGAAVGYACAVPQCETALAAAPDGSVLVAPVALALACVQDHAASLPPDLAGSGALPARVEVLIRLHVDDGVGPPRDAVQRLPVWTTAPTSPLNLPPAFAATAIRLDGAPAAPCADSSPAGLAACPPAATLRRAAHLPITASVDPGSIQDVTAGDRTAPESFDLSFFTTAGRFTEPRGGATRAAPDVATELKHEEVATGTADALLWVVLRDLRGGEAVTGPYRLAVEP